MSLQWSHANLGNHLIFYLWALKSLDIEDVCIFEKHHKHKQDSPSGTSLEIEKVVRERFGISPQMLSLRGGCEVGTHSVSLYFGDECIEISHKAFSRKAFAQGVVWVVGLIDRLTDSGLYSFEDVMQKN
jgi:4-hydroxy-tetrahydrodipicolinate reductase